MECKFNIFDTIHIFKYSENVRSVPNTQTKLDYLLELQINEI